jgi:hypothetical protein
MLLENVRGYSQPLELHRIVIGDDPADEDIGTPSDLGNSGAQETTGAGFGNSNPYSTFAGRLQHQGREVALTLAVNALSCPANNQIGCTPELPVGFIGWDVPGTQAEIYALEPR